MDNENNDMNRSIQLLRSFANIQKNVMRYVQKTATDHDLSIPQYTVLMTMIHHGEMTQKMVGKKTFLPKSTLSLAIDGLVQADLLTRRQVVGNRREIELEISEEGKNLIKAIHLQDGGIHQIFLQATESLSEKQFQDLLYMHKQIATYFEERGRNTE